jgi:hypothetical protein
MKTRTQLIRISGVAIVLQCRRPAWNRPQRSGALFCVRVIFALIVASVLRKLARMRVWFCGVTLVDARQSVYASVNYALPIARGNWLGGWEISGINSMRTGLPLTVTVSRKSTDLPGRQQQLAAARPDSNVSLVPATGRHCNHEDLSIAAAEERSVHSGRPDFGRRMRVCDTPPHMAGRDSQFPWIAVAPPRRTRTGRTGKDRWPPDKTERFHRLELRPLARASGGSRKRRAGPPDFS